MKELIIGLAGTCLGFFGAFIIYYLSSWRTNKERLISHLMNMIDHRLAYIEGDGVTREKESFEKNFSTTYTLFFAYKKSLVWPATICADKAWQRYSDTPKNDFGITTPTLPTTDGKASERISGLLKDIRYTQ
tara:strand:+ start:216 stop:611 length:396 start_codon:yes stop_codon:yes gene_type:complete